MKKYRLSFLFIILLSTTMACDTVNGPQPSFELYSQNFNGGNPESWVDIDPNGQTITQIHVDWGRHAAENQSSQLYATSSLNELGNYFLFDISSGNEINTPLESISAPFRLYVKFGFTELMDDDEVLSYKIRTTHLAENDDGEEGILYTWSEQFKIDHETFPSGEEPGPGGGMVDNEPCPDPIPAPKILWPLDGDSCVGNIGSIGSKEATVEFRWEGIEGIDKMPQAYQVEIRTFGAAACDNGWQEGVSGYYGVLPNCWITDVNSPLWSENLPLNATYQWRVRASCVLEGDDELTSGEFTALQTFTTASSIDCQNQ